MGEASNALVAQKSGILAVSKICCSPLLMVAWVRVGEPMCVVHTLVQPASSEEPSRGETPSADGVAEVVPALLPAWKQD